MFLIQKCFQREPQRTSTYPFYLLDPYKVELLVEISPHFEVLFRSWNLLIFLRGLRHWCPRMTASPFSSDRIWGSRRAAVGDTAAVAVEGSCTAHLLRPLLVWAQDTESEACRRGRLCSSHRLGTGTLGLETVSFWCELHVSPVLSLSFRYDRGEFEFVDNCLVREHRGRGVVKGLMLPECLRRPAPVFLTRLLSVSPY